MCVNDFNLKVLLGLSEKELLVWFTVEVLIANCPFVNLAISHNEFDGRQDVGSDCMSFRSLLVVLHLLVK